MVRTKAIFHKYQVGKVYLYDTSNEGNAIYVLSIQRDEYYPKNSKIVFIDTKDYFGLYSDDGKSESWLRTSTLTTKYLGNNTFTEDMPNYRVPAIEETLSEYDPRIYAYARKVKPKLVKKRY